MIRIKSKMAIGLDGFAHAADAKPNPYPVRPVL